MYTGELCCINKSNTEMAEILDVEIKYYETIKRNGGPLDYDRLYALYKKAQSQSVKASDG